MLVAVSAAAGLFKFAVACFLAVFFVQAARFMSHRWFDASPSLRLCAHSAIFMGAALLSMRALPDLFPRRVLEPLKLFIFLRRVRFVVPLKWLFSGVTPSWTVGICAERLMRVDLPIGQGRKQRSLKKNMCCNNHKVAVDGCDLAVSKFAEKLADDVPLRRSI